METLKKWWNTIALYFATLDAEVEETKEKTPTEGKIVKTTTPKTKTTKAVEQSTVKASTAVKLITEAIEGEKDSGKKKYKSRLSRELNKAIESKDKEAVSKSVSRIVKYLEK